MPQLDVSLVLQVNEYRALLEVAMSNAADADARVVFHRRRIRRYCIRQHYSENAMRDKFKLDYDLSDALDSYRYWCSEVQRYASAIQALAAVYQVKSSSERE